MAALEKRHGTLNSTHDASLDDLSEVTIPNFCLENILIFFCLTNFKHFLIVKLQALSFIESPAKRSRPDLSLSPDPSRFLSDPVRPTRKGARKQLHLDDDGYSSFSAQTVSFE